MIRQFLNQIKIFDCGMTKGRLGNDHDGGYVVAMEPLALANDLYSFGIGDDVGFELDFLRLFPDANVNLFDPTIDELPVDDDRLIFCRKGISSKFSNGGLPVKVPENSFLKMDVEWSEWEALLEVSFDRFRFSQMVVEFHVLHMDVRSGLSPYFNALYQSVVDRQNRGLFRMYRDCLEWVNNWYHCFHIHANNSLPRIVAGGYEFPPLLEMSFIRKDLAKSSSEIFPVLPVTGLDKPNKTDRPDILAWFPPTFERKANQC